MASFSEARETPVEQLWDEIEDIHAGMLGLEGGHMHMQPMAPFADPKLTMLALKLDDGEIWASTGNPLKFGWEIAKANLSDDKQPDIGVHRRVSFA